MKTITDDVVLEPVDRCGGVEKMRHRRLRQIAPGESAWWRTVHAVGPSHAALAGTVEIAEALDRRPQTVRLWRMRGLLPPAVIVRGRLRHVRRELVAWAAQRGMDTGRLRVPQSPAFRTPRVNRSRSGG